MNFLRLAEVKGYSTGFARTAVSPGTGSDGKAKKSDYLAVGYRLDPQAARNLIRSLRPPSERETALLSSSLAGPPV